MTHRNALFGEQTPNPHSFRVSQKILFNFVFLYRNSSRSPQHPMHPPSIPPHHQEQAASAFPFNSADSFHSRCASLVSSIAMSTARRGARAGSSSPRTKVRRPGPARRNIVLLTRLHSPAKGMYTSSTSPSPSSDFCARQCTSIWYSPLSKRTNDSSSRSRMDRCAPSSNSLTAAPSHSTRPTARPTHSSMASSRGAPMITFHPGYAA